MLAFHQGMSWVAQIALFFLLGLLVFPSQLGDVAGDGLLLSAALILVARPVAALLATASRRSTLRERLMLGWAGLRGAIPIWLATFPVIAGVEGERGALQRSSSSSSSPRRWSRARASSRWPSRLGVTTDEPALPRPVVESGTIRELGGDCSPTASATATPPPATWSRSSACRARRSST